MPTWTTTETTVTWTAVDDPSVTWVVQIGGTGGGTFDGVHNDLSGRSTANAHPISAITGLQSALDAATNASVLRVAVVVDDPGDLGGTFDSDEWTVAALSSVPTTGDLSLLAVIGTDPDDMSGASTGLFRHAGGGVFERVRTWDLSDAGRWLLAIYELAPGLGEVVWLYLVGGSTLGYSSLAAGDLTAGHMIDIDGGVVSLKKRRIIPTITAGLFEGNGIADCMELVPGDPAGVARPTVTAIDGVDLAAPRVAGVKNPLTASLSGFWEVFEVGAPGYLQPSDFAAPQPDVGDFYFERVTELNGQWTDDALFGSTPVYVGQGNVWGGRVVWTFGDGLDCNFAPSQVDVSEIYGLANIATSGDYEDLSGAPTLAAVATSGDYQDLDNLPTLGTAAAANSTDFATASHVHAGEDITSGTVAAARLGSGTPSASNFLRGDGSWQVPPGGGGTGDVVGPASSVDGRVALFDGTTGKLLKQSSAAPVLEGDARLSDTRTPTDGTVTNAKVSTTAAIANSKLAGIGGASTYASVQSYSLPGVLYTALANAIALGSGTIRYVPFLIRTGSLSVDRILCEVTTLQSGSNLRLGVYAADSSWQPTGAALIDVTASGATTGSKNVTVSPAVSLAAGRYLACVVADANVSIRRGACVPSWGTDHGGSEVTSPASAQVIGNRRVALTYPASLPDTGPAWTTVDSTATPFTAANDVLILLRGTLT